MKTDIIIRNMVNNDYIELIDLWNKCEGIGLNEIDDSQQGINRFLQHNQDLCFVAINNGTITGSIMTGHDGRRGHIYHLAVHPLHRRQGIARELVRKAICQLKKHDIHKISLVVFAANGEGNIFWEKLGFKIRPDLVYRDKCIED